MLFRSHQDLMDNQEHLDNLEHQANQAMMVSQGRQVTGVTPGNQIPLDNQVIVNIYDLIIAIVAVSKLVVKFKLRDRKKYASRIVP